jgi:serine/threonine-protein kinase
MEASFFVDRSPSVRKIGGFDVIADIGRSGSADLYLALAPEQDGRRNRVVIKYLPESEDDEERATFLDEARLARRLSHPNLIQTIDVGKDGRSYFIIAECLDGLLLSRIRKRSANRTPVPLAIELRFASEVLAGLHYLHELKDDDGGALDVVHRDVTPQRVFVTYDGEVKIADFAIAKASVRQAETQVGVVKGDLLYFAPEILRRQPVDRRADVFAVGMMLWEAAAGRRFWAGFSTSEIHHRLLSGDIPRETAPPDVPEAVLDIIQQAMEPDPDRRFATANAMRQAIDEQLGDRPDATKAAISAHLQRAFVDERRRFYQSARAAEERLDRASKPVLDRPAPLPAIDSETLVRVAPTQSVVTDASPATLPARNLPTPPPEEIEETKSTPTSASLITSFAQPTWRPPSAGSPLPHRIPTLVLCLGAAAMLAAGWALAQIHSHPRGAVVATAVVQPVASAPNNEPHLAMPEAPSAASPAVSATASASAPKLAPHVPVFGVPKRTVRPNPEPAPQGGDPFGI